MTKKIENGSVDFLFDEAKVKFTLEGKEYALRISEGDLNTLIQQSNQVIPKVGVVTN